MKYSNFYNKTVLSTVPFIAEHTVIIVFPFVTNCVLFFFLFFLLFWQAFLQDLGQGQAAVAAFNELSAHLLHEYSGDDTRRIKEVTDKHNAVWNSINKR